ncbi:Ribonuclease H-like superfamily [Fusarium oxysporum f. sp. vasinfectum]|nr:Ribonuclease H-like superfamily [Fusarium oxysporum f. sp. vasinfectum]
MSNKGGRPKTHGVHEHFAAAPIPPGGGKFSQLRVRCKYCSKTMAKHVQRQQNHLAKECLGFQQAAGHVDRQPRITTALSIMDRNSKDQLDRAAALAIFKSGKPYTTFEDSGMVEFIQKLNPAYKPPSGDRIATILPEKAFITPAITHWGTQLGAVMSSLANKDALRAYARDAMVLNSLKAKAIKGEEEEEEDQQVLRAILSSINNFEFWHEVEMLAKILRPIENAQRCSERDHSCVGEVIPRWLTIQSRWDALEEANQDPLINYSELRQWRVQRMKGQTTDIHHFAFALDPRTTIGEGLGLDTMERAHRFLEENTSNEEYQQLFGEFCRFRAREGALFGPTSRIYREQPKTPHTPSHYYILSAWGYFGSMGVKLATLARRVLGSLANSVPSERSFSATNYLHCKLRNRLSPLSTDKVTFIYMNSRVLKRLKTVKDNPAEPMVVKNWETVDVARLVKIENAFQDSIVVDGWGWEETDLEDSGDDMDIGQ